MANARSLTCSVFRILLTASVWIVGLYSLFIHVRLGFNHSLTAYLLDAGVFQDAGQALLHGNPLYSDAFPSRSGFRFIYPPFAAVLFIPLGLIPEHTMQVLWTLASISAVFGVLAMAVYRLGLGVHAQDDTSLPSRQRTSEGSMTRLRFGTLRHLGTWWIWALALTGIAISLEPVDTHLMYGQINIFLVLIVTADVLAFTPRPIRGLGIGLAAGIKITPAAYALIFLVRRDWWSLARSVGFFLATAAIGFLMRSEESIYFWTDEFFNSERGGAPQYPPNQALTGLLARAGMDPETALTVMLPGFVIIAGLSVWGAWRFERAGRRVESLLLVVLGIVLAAPLAVTHHWVGIVLMLALVFRPAKWWLVPALLLSLYAHFKGLHALYMGDYEGHPELHGLIFPEFFLTNSQGLTGLVIFLTLLVAAGKIRGDKGEDSEEEVDDPKEALI